MSFLSIFSPSHTPHLACQDLYLTIDFYKTHLHLDRQKSYRTGTTTLLFLNTRPYSVVFLWVMAWNGCRSLQRPDLSIMIYARGFRKCEEAHISRSASDLTLLGNSSWLSASDLANLVSNIISLAPTPVLQTNHRRFVLCVGAPPPMNAGLAFE